MGPQAKAVLEKLWRSDQPRAQRARLCVACNGIIGVDDEVCPHCNTRQTTARKAVRAVRVAMPGTVSVTNALLAVIVVAHLIPVLFMSRTLLDPGAFLTKGSGAIMYLFHSETGEHTFVKEVRVGDSYRPRDTTFLVNAPVLMGANHGPLNEQGEVWRLITAMFLHGGLMHLFFNGYALFVLGRPTEGLYGWGWMLTMYTAAGIGGNLVSWVGGVFAFPAVQLGASGAIFGLIGMGIVHCWRHRWVNQALLRNLLMWAGLSLAFGFVIGADNWAHVGGLVVGAGLAWLLPAEKVTKRGPMQTLGNVLGVFSIGLIAISGICAMVTGLGLLAQIP